MFICVRAKECIRGKKGHCEHGTPHEQILGCESGQCGFNMGYVGKCVEIEIKPKPPELVSPIKVEIIEVE